MVSIGVNNRVCWYDVCHKYVLIEGVSMKVCHHIGHAGEWAGVFFVGNMKVCRTGVFVLVI